MKGRRIIKINKKNNMPLPHYTQLSMTIPPQEPVYLNLFETAFVLPNILQARGYDGLLLLEQGTNININTTPEIPTVTQRFKYSTRVFLSAGPDQTHTSFNISYQVNVNDSGAMESWDLLKAWFDLGWNSQNGVLHYKRDCIGTAIAQLHDKQGWVTRRVTFHNVQCTGISSFELDWSKNSDILTLTASFVADYWTDEYISQGNGIGVNFGQVSGY